MVSLWRFVCWTPGFMVLCDASNGAVNESAELPKALIVSGGTRFAKTLGRARLRVGKAALALSRNLQAEGQVRWVWDQARHQACDGSACQVWLQ